MKIDQVIKSSHVNADPLLWFPLLEAAAEEFGIPDGDETAAFLANGSHETGGFISFSESLNYRWDVLLDKWGHRMTPTQAAAVGRVDDTFQVRNNGGVIYKGVLLPTKPHKANQEAIANLVYGGRFGNTEPGDGWKFRGRGVFQFTFHDNYLAYSNAVGVPEIMTNPDLMMEPQHAARSAGFFWKWKNLGSILKTKGIVGVRKVVNGGDNGLKEVTHLYNSIR